MAHDTKHGDKTRSGTFAGSPPAGPAFDTIEDAFWRGQYMRETYFQGGMTYEDYQPAYRFGYESYKKYPGRKFEDVERDMGGQWDKVKAKSRLAWEHAKHAVRATWDRMEKAVTEKKPTEHY
jgi:hypothetical protein